MTRPAYPTVTLRWKVRLEAARGPRLGETRRDVLRWAVRAVNAQAGAQTTPTYFGSLAAAQAFARRECARLYGCQHPTHPHHRRNTR